MTIEIMGRGPKRRVPTPDVDKRMWISIAVGIWTELDPEVDEVWNIHRRGLYEHELPLYKGSVHLDSRYANMQATQHWLSRDIEYHVWQDYYLTEDFGIASSASLILAYLSRLGKVDVILNGIDLLGPREKVQKTNLLLYIGAYFALGMRVRYVDGRKLYHDGGYT